MRRIVTLFLLVLSLSSAPHVRADEEHSRTPASSPYIAGQFLVAAPGMPDPRFAETVIYMVDHDRDGAFGVIVNRPVGRGPLDKFLKGFGIEAKNSEGVVRLLYGGPVEYPNRLFVIHTSDWWGESTIHVNGPVALSVQPDVLKAVADGTGPRDSMVVLGYAGWGPNQLELEMARNDWVTAPLDMEIVFDEDIASKWERATEAAGIPL